MRATSLLAALVIAVAACAQPSADDGAALTVFAPASLAAAMTQVGEAFGVAHPDVSVEFSFAGSQRLAGQILQGAPADVFASADERQMERVVAAGQARATPVVIAHNRLAIAVPPGNPDGVGGLADLPGLVVVLAAPEVPSGRYAAQALSAAGVEVSPSSLEADVRGVVSKVALGEADAGIVYHSDLVAAAERIDGVAIAAEHNVDAAYPIVALTANPAAAAFVDFVQGPQAQAIFADHGFSPP